MSAKSSLSMAKLAGDVVFDGVEPLLLLGGKAHSDGLLVGEPFFITRICCRADWPQRCSDYLFSGSLHQAGLGVGREWAWRLGDATLSERR